MNWALFFGIFFPIYALVCFYVALAKPEWIWKTGKVRWFVKTLGENGTVIMLVLIGTAALIGGLVLLFS